MSAAADAGSAAAAAAADAADAAASTGTAGDVIDTNGVSVISSLCVACEARGETRLLLLKIPFFRDIILAAFSCEACGEQQRDEAPRQGRAAGCRAAVGERACLQKQQSLLRRLCAVWWKRSWPIRRDRCHWLCRRALTPFHRRRAQQRGADCRVRARRRHL